MYTYQYPRPALTVDALLFVRNGENMRLLMIRRANEPFKNKWALPGGFMDMNETLEEACRRELQEETGIVVDHLEQFRVYDAIDRDPRHRTISVVFYAKMEREIPPAAGDDAAQAAWFDVNELPELAFDHAKIVEDFLLFLNSK